MEPIVMTPLAAEEIKPLDVETLPELSFADLELVGGGSVVGVLI